MMLQYKIPKSKTILHSIPIGSIMVLLLFSLCLLNPQLFSSSSAAYATENNNVSNSINNASTHANDTDSSTSLIIGGAEMNEVVDASVGEVAYRKHTVTISASKLKSYTLFISGPEGLKGDTTITGANGNTPTDMPKNSWGYAYGQVGSEYDMTYNSFTNNAELIDSKLESESSTEDTDFTKNLIFAVKFGNAIAGHYTGTVTLSLAAEPKEVVLPTNPVENWDELQSMQQMTSKACESIGTAGSGTYPSKTLVDSRDSNEYTITKLDDQNCWMTTNLKLDISEANSLTGEDSNIANGTTWPEENLIASGFTNENSKPVWNNGTGITNSNQWKEEYGYYYNWCAVTAGSCNSAIDEGTIVSASICPKGWRLPTNSEYSNFLSKAGIANSSAGSTKIRDTPYNFPYAGDVGGGSLGAVGSSGYYWSSTADSSSAYVLYFGRSLVGTTSTGNRYLGFSVRCIAMNSDDEKKQEETIKNTPVDNWADVEYMQQMSTKACESAGTAGSGNYPSKTLKDSRDDNTYIVTKLDDQKCWMTQNLRITGDSIKAKDPSNNTSTITSVNSNISNNYNVPASSSLWSDDSATTDKVYYANKNNGAYYTWYTATAGTQGSSYSICPKGWKLPTIAQYESMMKVAGINFMDCKNDCTGSSNHDDLTKIMRAPYSFPFTGRVSGSQIQYPGNYGYYWSSTANTANYASDLTISGSEVYTESDWRYYGYAIRCISE